MIKQVSWTEYFTILVIGLIVYYFFVLLIYYRSDLIRILSAKRMQFESDEPVLENEFNTETTQETEETFGEANRLIGELKEIFRHNYIREELIMALQLKLREYPSLKQTAFSVSISNYIEQENEKRSIRLSEEDLRVLW